MLKASNTSSTFIRAAGGVLIAGACFFPFALNACKDDATLADGASCTNDSAGGPVKAPAGTEEDTHCIDSSGKAIALEIDEAACKPPTTDAGAADHDHDGDDAGTDTAAPADHDHAEEAEPHYGTESDDDDCKYHVKWSSSCVQQGNDITFTVKATTMFDGKPAKGLMPYIEAYLSDDHLAPDTNAKFKETAPGEYTIGPVRFDKAGKWTVKFHFRANCVELQNDSPHGHVAFYVNVP